VAGGQGDEEGEEIVVDGEEEGIGGQ